MDKRFWICGAIMSLAALLLDFLIHGLLLQADYDALVPGGFVRAPADAQRYLPYMLAAHVLIGFGLTWLFGMVSAGRRANASLGLRFGAAVAVLATLPGYLIYYAVQPWPATLVHKQMLLGTIAMLLLGLLVAYLQPRRVVL